MHVAGFKYAGVSVTAAAAHLPAERDGHRGAARGAMQEHGVDSMVFSSSAAVYGTPDVDLVTEDTPKHPESPYGESKLIGEWLLADQARRDRAAAHRACATSTSSGPGTTSVFDVSPHNLFPLVFDALLERAHAAHQRRRLPDARRHLRARLHPRRRPRRWRTSSAARRLDAGEPIEPVYNLGCGDGVSVRRDHGARWRRSRHRVHPRDRAAPRRAIPRASSHPATSRPATSTGACATRLARDGRPARGRPGNTAGVTSTAFRRVDGQSLEAELRVYDLRLDLEELHRCNYVVTRPRVVGTTAEGDDCAMR